MVESLQMAMPQDKSQDLSQDRKKDEDQVPLKKPLSHCTDTEKIALMKEAILENRKRTFQMYSRERQDYKLAEIDQVIS